VDSKNSGFGRRTFLSAAALAPLAAAAEARGKHHPAPVLNLALVSTVTSSRPASKAERSALNSGYTPASSGDGSHNALRFWEPETTQWVDYTWVKPVTLDRVEVYWHTGGTWLYLPQSYRVLAWNGAAFEPVVNANGFGLAKDQFNATTFKPVKTNRVRLEIIPDGKQSFGILQWKAFGTAADLPPRVDAGLDRTLIAGAPTYLAGEARWLIDGAPHPVQWSKRNGPGALAFADAGLARTTATASVPGDYALQFAVGDRHGPVLSSLKLKVEEAPPPHRLDVVYTTPYTLTSPFWKARSKALIVNWIPHCIAQCERTDLTVGEGGLDNLIEASKALRG